MATRARHSTVQPTPRASRASRAGTAQPSPARINAEAPPYEQPSFTLNPNAQRALANLKRSHDLQKLDKSLENALTTLSQAAADINERLANKRKKLENHNKKVQQRREQNETLEDDDEYLEQLQGKHDDLQTKVDGMNQRMEEASRMLIDNQEFVEALTQALDASAEDARNNASTQASTQIPRTQRPRRLTQGDEDEEEEEVDEEIPDFQPTDPAAGAQPGQSPIDVYKKTLDDTRLRYQNYSHFERYSENEKYVDYRRSVHHAAYHPEDNVPPLPPKDTWFDDDGTVAPIGFTRRPNENDDDSDDDLAVSRVTISTKCPITLREFVNPLTSKKCDHSFEAEAILDMLHRSIKRLPPQQGQARGVQAVQCPVSACSQMLARYDLQKNEWVIRKIKRQQKAKQQAQEEDEEVEKEDNEVSGRDTGWNLAQRISNDDDDDVDIDNEALIKQEAEQKASGASRSQDLPSDSQPTRPSVAIGLLDDDEKELYE